MKTERGEIPGRPRHGRPVGQCEVGDRRACPSAGSHGRSGRVALKRGSQRLATSCLDARSRLRRCPALKGSEASRAQGRRGASRRSRLAGRWWFPVDAFEIRGCWPLGSQPRKDGRQAPRVAPREAPGPAATPGECCPTHPTIVMPDGPARDRTGPSWSGAVACSRGRHPLRTTDRSDGDRHRPMRPSSRAKPVADRMSAPPGPAGTARRRAQCTA